MFDRSIGRWLTEDPIAFDGGDANLYRYVGNQSINATDPSGLKISIGNKLVPTTNKAEWVKTFTRILGPSNAMGQ